MLADDTFVKAVVVSLIVGNGRPMTVITAAAIPPEPPAAEAMSPPETAPDGAPDTFQRKPMAVVSAKLVFAIKGGSG